MATKATDTIEYCRRSAAGCLCCGSAAVRSEATVISTFLARRAMGTDAALTRIVFCANCGFRFFDRGLSEAEAKRYYLGYRSDEYCKARNRCEPFYTSDTHREIATWLASPQRRRALFDALCQCGRNTSFNSVLDYGGGDGLLIANLDAKERAVLDPSGVQPVEGVVGIDDDGCRSRQWDLIVCAQVLEHLNDPRQTITYLAGLLAPEGLLYLEVPDEIWKNHCFPGALRDRWLHWLTRRPAILRIADVLSTAFRIKLGILPPFGFIPMREHLQYFTESSLGALVRTCRLDVVGSGRNSVGQIYAVATRHALAVPC